MEIKLIFIIFCVSQICGNETINKEYYYPDDDGGAFMMKMMFTRLNEILLQNQNISKNVWNINQRLQNQTKLLQEVTQLTEDVASIKKLLNETLSVSPVNQQQVWTIIQRRQDGSEDFNRNWTDYKKGFGNQYGEFFIGLDKLHEITTYNGDHELLITLKDFENQTRYAKYDNFVVGSEMEKYILKTLGSYSGDAGDSLRRHKGAKFSTKDQNNGANKFLNCASQFTGGWWFHDGCYTSHLNGLYLHGLSVITGGINWNSWHGINYSLKFVEMSIRPKSLK